jgi:phosphate transport system substrate-binding protein
MIPRRVSAALSLVVCLTGAAGAAQLPQRQHILIVGSSTTYPIIAAAGEYFSRRHPGDAPVIESTGSGGGIKLFCNGLGLATPDITMTSRPMKSSERQRCLRNQVTDIREIMIGYDGIVLANSKLAPEFELTRQDLFLAIAREVPDPQDPTRLIANPYQSWQQLNPELPDLQIRVLGPPPTSGTRDILLERLLEPACRQVPALQLLFLQSPDSFLQHCHALREDGAFVNAGENDARLVRKLVNDPVALGIFGYNFLDRNRHKLQAATIDGVEPAFELIENGVYPLSRPLFLYLKSHHVKLVHGLEDFIQTVVSPALTGPEGYLVERGLVPLPVGD